MTDINDLYQSLIIDHNRSPLNFGKLPGYTHMSVGHNPLCGDQLTVYLIVDGDTVQEIYFEGSGCAISKASASLMTGSLKGKTIQQVRDVFERFHKMMTKEDDPDVESLGKLAAFSGVRRFPMRVKCATLSWHTVIAAIDDCDKVSTE